MIYAHLDYISTNIRIKQLLKNLCKILIFFSFSFFIKVKINKSLLFLMHHVIKNNFLFNYYHVVTTNQKAKSNCKKLPKSCLIFF